MPDCDYVFHTPDRRKGAQLVHISLIISYTDRQPKEDIANDKSIAFMIPQESPKISMSTEYNGETEHCIEIPVAHIPQTLR